MILIRFICLLLLLLATTSALAEGRCPQGMAPYDTPGVAACVPTGGPRGGEVVSQAPLGRWRLTWGAIALASDGSDSMGVSSGKLFENEANLQALRQCQQGGLRKCDVAVSYENQCAAMAFPIVASVGIPRVARAGSISAASALAIDACTSSAKAACEVLYTNCTKPIYQRF